MALAWAVTPKQLHAQHTEYVTVKSVKDDSAVVVRRDGAVYSIEKGVGCLSLWRYEGRQVVINSPGLFLGVGSTLVIPQLDQTCRIWTATEVESASTDSPAPNWFAPAPSLTRDDCFQSSVMNPVPFMGNNGEIFKLIDGSLWRVNYAYEYLYEYYPTVSICPSAGKLLVRGKTLSVQAVSVAAAPTPSQPQPAVTPEVIESRIDGEFSGWEGETIFKLQNGQLWQQVSYAYKYKYAYSPEVLFYKSGGGYKMRVTGVDGEIAVRRLK